MATYGFLGLGIMGQESELYSLEWRRFPPGWHPSSHRGKDSRYQIRPSVMSLEDHQDVITQAFIFFPEGEAF